jgi:hypothetical protein
MAVAASAARMEAEAQREIQVARVQSNARPEQARAADNAGDAPAERPSDASAHDPDRTVAALIRERAQAFGDRGHAHGSDGCGFCQGAARAYQP